MTSRLHLTACALAIWAVTTGAQAGNACPLQPDPDDPICSPQALNEAPPDTAPIMDRSTPPAAEAELSVESETSETVVTPEPAVPEAAVVVAEEPAPAQPPATPEPIETVSPEAPPASVETTEADAATSVETVDPVPPPAAVETASPAAPFEPQINLIGDTGLETPPPAEPATAAVPVDSLFGAPEGEEAATQRPQNLFGALPGAAPPPAVPGDLVIRETRRVALIIGNSAYPTAPLRNPVNDAMLMQQTLTNLGFEVHAHTDLSQFQMKQAISEFGAKIRNGGVGLFYYAGHGLQIDGENYLIPTDAQIEHEGDVDTWGVNMQTVLKHMGKAENHLNIVILDACRDNPFARSWRSGAKGLAELDAPTGTYVAYATAPGRTASDGDGNNGLYTQALSQAMSTPGLRLEDVFIATRRAVERRSAGVQTPWENGSLTGVFYFNGAGTPSGVPAPIVASMAPVVPVETTQSRELLELAVWSSVKNSAKKEDLELYLSKFPKGVYAEEAQQRLAYLHTPASMVDAVAPGGFLELRGMPLLDTSVMHQFGDWLVLRRPNKSRVRVMTSGLDKLPVIQSPGKSEQYYFYYTPDPKVALQLTLEDDDEDLVYQTPKLAVKLNGCGSRGRAGKIDPRDELNFARNLPPPAEALEIPDGYGVLMTTDEEQPEKNSLRRQGDRLLIGMEDFRVELASNAPEVRIVESDNDSCSFK